MRLKNIPKVNFYMEIIIYIKRKKTDCDYRAAVEEYAKRMSAFCRMRIMPCRDYRSLCLEKNKTNTKSFAVLCGTDTVTSPAFAEQLQALTLSGTSTIEYAICETDADYEALSDSYQKTHDKSLPLLHLSSFSPDAGLTAVLLSEQLYRAYTILNHITYHK